MARSAIAEIEIERPPEEIWPWLADPRKRLDWVAGLEDLTPVEAADGALRVGSRWIEHAEHGGRSYDFEVAVRELEAPDWLRLYLAAAGGFAYDQSFRIDAGEAASSVMVEQRAVFHHWVARLLGGLMTRALAKKLRHDLARLKAAIEGAG